jgi:outer membrane PBP1 activator LpoA protein
MKIPNFKYLTVTLLAIIVAGCAGQAARESDISQITDAEARLRAGDYLGASQIYQDLEVNSNAPDYYRMMVAYVSLRSGNTREAQGLLAQVIPDKLGSEEQSFYQVLKSWADLNQGKAKDAMTRLNSFSAEQLAPSNRRIYYKLRASAYNQLGDMLNSARERLVYASLIKNPDEARKNNEAIFETLDRIPVATLQEIAFQEKTGDLAGWVDLVLVTHAPANQRYNYLQTWLQRHPEHPAAGEFVDSLKIKPGTGGGQAAPQATKGAAAASTNGALVGVLLPLTGPYASLAQAAKDGIEAAHNVDTRSTRPRLEYVDTQNADVVALYRNLVRSGARAVIGPLTKEDLAILGKSGDLSVTVLGLNQSQDINADKIYQFGLIPEQDLEQSAASAWGDSFRNALVLAPSSAFGTRMSSYFHEYWQGLGGKVLAAKAYTPGQSEYTRPVSELLSSVPAQNLAHSFVFLIADPRDARLIKPQIDAQQTVPLPVFAMSRIYDGHPDAAKQNQNLSGTTFCDIPWLLNDKASDPLSLTSLHQLADKTSESDLRLIAMGMDAYNLLPQLDALKNGSSFAGYTGRLSLLPGNRIHRQLVCALLEGGTLHLRGIAPSVQPGSLGGSIASR